MGAIELRCEGTLHGILTDLRWLEVKCKRRSCGAARGVVVLHTIDVTTGRVTQTKRYSDPQVRKESQHAADHTPAAVRAS